MLQPLVGGEWWECDKQGVPQTPQAVFQPLSIVTKGGSQSPTTRLSLNEESATIVLCSGEVLSLLDVHSGWLDS